jgi:hypothetical protein
MRRCDVFASSPHISECFYDALHLGYMVCLADVRQSLAAARLMARERMLARSAVPSMSARTIGSMLGMLDWRFGQLEPAGLAKQRKESEGATGRG